MATKKNTTKKVAKAAPKKAVAKSVAKKSAPAKKAPPKKATNKPTAKKNQVKAKPKQAKKTPAKKAVQKPAVKKTASKATAKSPASKPLVKKAASKSTTKKVAQKTTSKKSVSKVVTKKVVSKPSTKKATVKPAVKKVVSKPTVEKSTSKSAANKKPEYKSVSPKATSDKPVKTTSPIVGKSKMPPSVEKPIEKKVLKTFGVSSSNTPTSKKSDLYKTDTFATTNLKNETGKVIAHRKTSELKRKTEDYNTIKKYEPETRRSILDMDGSNTGPSFRYSDEDLQEFKELILKKLETAKAELSYLQGVIMRKDEGGTEDTENKYQNMEDGSASMEREQFNQLAGRQITFIQHLEQALVRIENKTYGICRVTGKLIDKARLRAVPHATLSIEAKNSK